MNHARAPVNLMLRRTGAEGVSGPGVLGPSVTFDTLFRPFQHKADTLIVETDLARLPLGAAGRR
jgi:hypothetical protein